MPPAAALGLLEHTLGCTFICIDIRDRSSSLACKCLQI